MNCFKVKKTLETTIFVVKNHDHEAGQLRSSSLIGLEKSDIPPAIQKLGYRMGPPR